MGWGRENENADISSQALLRAEIPILPMLQCTRQFLALQKTAFYSTTGICAGGYVASLSRSVLAQTPAFFSALVL